MDNAAPSEKRLSVFVSIGSLTLMKIGHVDAWIGVKSLLDCLGFEAIRNVVSRVDLCVDLPNVTMEPVQFCVDDDSIFTGRFTTSLSSIGFTDIAIDIFAAGENDTMVKLECGYPAGPAPDRATDPRFSHRLYTSLWLGGKLRSLPDGG